MGNENFSRFQGHFVNLCYTLFQLSIKLNNTISSGSKLSLTSFNLKFEASIYLREAQDTIIRDKHEQHDSLTY